MPQQTGGFRFPLLAYLWTPWDSALAPAAAHDRLAVEWRRAVEEITGISPTAEEAGLLDEAERIFHALEPRPRPDLSSDGIRSVLAVHPFDGSEIAMPGGPGQEQARERFLDILRAAVTETQKKASDDFDRSLYLRLWVSVR